MGHDLQKAIQKMTMAGSSNTRVVPEGSTYTIEVRIGGVWTPLVRGLTKSIAESAVNQASNRTICG